MRFYVIHRTRGRDSKWQKHEVASRADMLTRIEQLRNLYVGRISFSGVIVDPDGGIELVQEDDLRAAVQ